MLDNNSHNEKLLKIFAGIRCLNKDQLPRYLEGRLTDIEKHLVEQHLVDCDLCFEALQCLQQEGQLEQYQGLSSGIQQYIRESIKPVSQLQKMERYLRKVKQRESLLIYFWLVAFIVGGGSILYLMQEYSRHRPVLARPAAVPVVPVAAVAATPPPATTDSLSKPVSPVTVVPPPQTAIKKDTAKAMLAVVKKPPAVDSIARKNAAAAAARAADSAKLKRPATKDSTPKPAKDTPAPVIAKNTEKETVKAKEENSNNSTNKPTTAATTTPTSPATVADTDEFLYKAAMVYQQQGDLNEAITRYKRLSSSTGRIGEMARYQMAVCYLNKGQTGKARRMFKEVVRMDGTMKQAAQQALDNL